MNLLLIADIIVSSLVFLCVVLTLLDIAGGAYFMGLTIEIASSIILILAVGLALDYSAHIGVTYIVTRGQDRKQRTIDTLNTIGTAVFNGGFSTLLAFVLLAISDSYVFLTFLKVRFKLFLITLFVTFRCLAVLWYSDYFMDYLFYPHFCLWWGPPLCWRRIRTLARRMSQRQTLNYEQ